MTNKSKLVFNFLIWLGGVITGFIYIIQGLLSTIQYLSKHNFINIYTLIIFIIFNIFLIILLYKWIKSLNKKLSKFARSKMAEHDLSEYLKKSNNTPIIDIIPKYDLLKNWRILSADKALEWSDDAILTSFNIYLKINKNSINITCQAMYKSDWKKIEITIYLGNINHATYRDITTTSLKDAPVIAFFEEFPKWQGATIKAFNSISDELPESFEIQITSKQKHNDFMTINISYKIGKIEKREIFYYNGIELEYPRNNIKTKIL